MTPTTLFILAATCSLAVPVALFLVLWRRDTRRLAADNQASEARERDATSRLAAAEARLAAAEQALSAEKELRQRYEGQVQALTDALATYPQVDSALISRIGAAGGAEVSMSLTGYDADTGALRFDAQSTSVIDIPGYVLKLQSLGLFRKVDYTGYTYEDGMYVLSLNCILQGKETAE